MASVPTAMVIMLLIGLVAYTTQQQSTYAKNQAVIIAQGTPLYRLPAQNGDDKARSILNAGEYVAIMEKRSEWTRIRIDQNEGWVKRSSLDSIW